MGEVLNLNLKPLSWPPVRWTLTRKQRVTNRDELNAAVALVPPESLLTLSVESKKISGKSGSPFHDYDASGSRPADVVQRTVWPESYLILVDADAGVEASALAAELGVSSYPTVQARARWTQGIVGLGHTHCPRRFTSMECRVPSCSWWVMLPAP